MSNFSKNWDAPQRKTSAPSGPLKPHIEQAINLIGAQNQRLDIANSRLSEKDKTLFNKVVDSYAKHDRSRAMMYANELAEVRKVEKRVLQIKLALETISIRLTTVKDYGDFLNTVTPALSIIKGVQGSVLQVVPEAEKGFSTLSESLSSIVTEAGGTSSSMNVSFETANDDAAKILTDAASVAEQKIKEKFPDLPAEVSREGVQL
jgi:division protein CdvB (Snf7/Vps24/ESCRT-III family)